MAYEVKETSRNYAATPPHGSVVGGKFGRDPGRGKRVPLTPDRSGRVSRSSAKSHRKSVSHVQLAGRPRAIVPTTGSSLAVRNPF